MILITYVTIYQVKAEKAEIVLEKFDLKSTSEIVYRIIFQFFFYI